MMFHQPNAFLADENLAGNTRTFLGERVSMIMVWTSRSAAHTVERFGNGFSG
jgi:hypothetical protein